LGSGTPRNYKETVRWMRASADSGNADAQNRLAYFYFYGIAVQQDYTEAARLVRLAVQQGLPAAQTNLAYLFEQGKGVPLDYVAAYSYYSRALASGDSTGADQRKQLARIMTAKQLDEASAQTTTYSPQGPLQPSFPSANSFSLINQQH
jgi:TPR repeat protein